MSDQDDRMERAKRIREMREGRRDEDDGETDTEASENGDPPATDAGAAGGPEPGGAGGDEPGSTAGSDVADSDALAEVDDAVAAAVERVSDASAAVPDPEEMAEAATGAEGAGADTVEMGADAATDADVAGVAGGPDPESPAEVGAAARAGIAAGASSGEPETRVLEFTLDGEQFCLDIEYIEEIVKREGITRVPNTPEFVEGVVDLRGQITTILNPKVIIDTDDHSPGDLLVVFDGEEFDEQGHIGWVVDDVRQVSPVGEDDVNDPPVEDDHVEGVIDRGDDEEFVVWTSPELALDEAI